MAQLGRTRLLGVALKRFLTQVQRHDPAAYANLPEALRQRYAPSEHLLFGDVAQDRQSRRLLRQQVAEDLHQVLRQFADQPAHAKRSSYQAMERIFQEQCEVQEEKVTVKDKTGNTVMQNPSDPDASYDGHKGPGYQVQIAETCSPDNEVQLITSALPQTAAVPDEEAVAPVLADLKASQLLPEELLGDTHYPSEENVQLAESYGVELVGPVPGAAPVQRPDDLTIDDFVIDEKTEQVSAVRTVTRRCVRCPIRPAAGPTPRCRPPCAVAVPTGISARSKRLPRAIIWSTRPSSGGWRNAGESRTPRSSASGIAAAVASRAPTVLSNAGRAWAACGCGAGPGCSRPSTSRLPAGTSCGPRSAQNA